MSTAMELTNEALETIGNYVRSNLGTWIGQLGSTTTPFRHLDEQFQHVGTRLDRSETRLDAVELRLEKLETRLEIVDQSINQLNVSIGKMDVRFEAFEKRFDDLSRNVVRWFTVMTLMLGAIGIVVTIASVF